MTGTAIQFDDDGAFDIGGTPDRPTQPAEPSVSDRDLDALREKWRAEAREDACDLDWWQTRAMRDAGFARCALQALVFHAEGQNGPAQATVDIIIEQEAQRMEREYFSEVGR